MRGHSRRSAFILEGLKLLALVVVLYAVEEQVAALRREVRGSRGGIAHAEARYARGLDAARREMEESLGRLSCETDEIKDFVEMRTLELEGNILCRLESERQDLLSTRCAIDAQRAALQRLSTTMKRDAERMKKRMILPTVQLKGNGTVGSGVIVYSRPQGADGEPTATTFILTAYHVVMEVLGDRLDDGILRQVHVLLEKKEDVTKVHAAKLVLFDRDRDLALLRLNSREQFPRTAVLLRPEDFRRVGVFTKAYAVGCPLGNRPLPTLGEISSTSKAVGDQVFWMLSAPTYFGNSGGGIYLAETCELIGISSMIYTYGKTHPTVVPHMGLFVPLDTICSWLDAEGYRFVYEGKPIPDEMLWKLVYREEGQAAFPSPSSGPETEMGAR